MAKGSVFRDPLGTRIQNNTKPDATEDAVIAAVQQKMKLDALKPYQKSLAQLRKGTLDIPAFLQELAPAMMEEILVVLKTTPSDKMKVEIAQDILDRAGHGKITKGVFATAPVNLHTAREDLVRKVMQLARKSKTIEFKEKKDDEKDDVIVDVTPEPGVPGK